MNAIEQMIKVCLLRPDLVTPQETNERFKLMISHGQTGLNVAFDLPTHVITSYSIHYTKLYDMAREKMMREKPDAEETKQVDHSYVNLIRMWSEV